jgi:molecular chaperone GrpE
MERERRETFQSQLGNLATQMLPALDNLNRAVDFAMDMPDEQRVEIRQFFDGIALVNQQVNEVLAGMGVQPIPTVGEEFDPNLHEAVATEETEEFEPNSISAELLRGYRIGDRVIRHSMVRVAQPGASRPAETLDQETEEVSETPDSDPDEA